MLAEGLVPTLLAVLRSLGLVPTARLIHRLVLINHYTPWLRDPYPPTLGRYALATILSHSI